MAHKPRILFVHYRTGERDGVSLEIENRARLLEEMGAEVHYLSGFDGLGRSNAKVIPLIDLRASYNTFLRENAFYKRLFDETTMLFMYSQLEQKFAARVDKYLRELKPDLIFVHNVFSHAYNLPFTTALLKVLDRYQFPTVAEHHDFWFERGTFRHPKYPFIQTILESLPPNRPYIIQHQVINTRAAKEMLSRRRIQPTVIGDYFDFDKPVPTNGHVVSQMLKKLDIKPDDLVILHATRITGRKAIELAIAYVHRLQKHIRKLKTSFQLNGRTVSGQTNITLLFPNFIEVDAVPYWDMLRNYADSLHVNVVWAFEDFTIVRNPSDGHTKLSYWDSYLAADLVTYTSVEEGFGNQFLEAIYYQKLPVVFEYPVFKQDIRQEGYHYISLGDKTRGYLDRRTVPSQVLDSAAAETLRYLQNPIELNQVTASNFRIARANHPTAALRRDLAAILGSLAK